MGYQNQVYRVPLTGAGLNASKNTDSIPPTASVVGSKNINLNEGGVSKRGGTAHVNAFAYVGTPTDSFDDSSLNGTLWGSVATAGGGSATIAETTVLTITTTDVTDSALVYSKDLYDKSVAQTRSVKAKATVLTSGQLKYFRVSHETTTPVADTSANIRLRMSVECFMNSSGDFIVRYRDAGGTLYFYNGSVWTTTSSTSLAADLDTVYRAELFSDGTYWKARIYDANDVLLLTTTQVAWADTYDSAENCYFGFGDWATNVDFGTFVVSGYYQDSYSKIVGLCDYTTTGGTQYIIRATGDGRILRNDSNTIKTGLGTDKVTSFAEMNNLLYICNGNDIPQVWTGSGNTTDLTNVPSDWTGVSYPKQMVNHGFANGEQMWAFGLTSNPYDVYCSKDNAGGTAEADFSDAEVTTIHINTGDGFGIIGGFEFQDRIFAVGKKQTYQIQDVDIDRANWGYQQAGWTGGAASHRLIVKIPNDVLMMMDDGEIYSITAVQQYGDYKSASLARPSFVHEWIKENVDLSKAEQFHAVYDPSLRAVKWFVVRSGQSAVDTALVYFIDLGPEKGWAIHDNLTYDSGYDAFSSAVIRNAASGGYLVYTGDYSGIIWKLEQATLVDNASGYRAVFRTAPMAFDDARTSKRYDRAFLTLRPTGNYNLNINVEFDGNIDSLATTMNMGGDGVALDAFLLDTDRLVNSILLESSFELGYVGRRVAFEFYNETASQDFLLTNLLIDFKPVGLRPSI